MHFRDEIRQSDSRGPTFVSDLDMVSSHAWSSSWRLRAGIRASAEISNFAHRLWLLRKCTVSILYVLEYLGIPGAKVSSTEAPSSVPAPPIRVV